jgi:hypothetical protein
VKKRGIPDTSLERKFKARKAEDLPTKKNPVDRLSKTRANASGSLFTAIEKHVLYNWIEYMRRRYIPPTPIELRSQVIQHNYRGDALCGLQVYYRILLLLVVVHYCNAI